MRGERSCRASRLDEDRNGEREEASCTPNGRTVNADTFPAVAPVTPVC